MAKKLVGLVLVLLSAPACLGWAQEPGDGETTVGIADVGQGSLLLKTNAPGRFTLAPVQSTEVEMIVRGMVVEAVVDQRFSNPVDDWMEGVYVFPLPKGAAVHSMRLIIGERVIEGQVKEKAEAKRVYEQAKNEGKKASLVEQERPNVFTTSVANIGPGEEITVRISYQEILEYDSGRFELRFPMVVGTRYIPGSPVEVSADGTGWAFDTDQVPDASKITPPVLHPGHRGKPGQAECGAGCGDAARTAPFPVARRRDLVVEAGSSGHHTRKHLCRSGLRPGMGAGPGQGAACSGFYRRVR